MKRRFTISCTFLILSLLLFQACKKEKPTLPVVVTATITDISYTIATSGGNVTNEGGAPVTRKGVCWNTSADPTISNNKTNDSVGAGVFTSHITNLAPNTKYYVRAYAINSAGTGYGDTVSFCTSQVLAPDLTTKEITSIDQYSAVSGGNITSDNGAAIIERGVCWSINQNPTITINKTSDGTGSGIFVSTINFLNGNTKYYVRAYATNSAGTEYGNQVSFITKPIPPTVSTLEISSITLTSAKCGGNVISDGGALLCCWGICWSTSHFPTISDSKTVYNLINTLPRLFYSSPTHLNGGTTYYVRAYASNIVGISYGNEISFTTLNYGSVTDIDSNTYKTIQIGTQIWMAENLKTTKFNKGVAISLVTDDNEWLYSTVPGYCWYNNDAVSNKTTYGALYNWYSADSVGNGGNNVCPAGWHVPTDVEWDLLINFVGGSSYAGVALKEIGTTHWQFDLGSTNEVGFTALPGGDRYGIFLGIGSEGNWWSSTDYNINNAWAFYLGSGDTTRFNTVKSRGASIRCLKN